MNVRVLHAALVVLLLPALPLRAAQSARPAPASAAGVPAVAGPVERRGLASWAPCASPAIEAYGDGSVLLTSQLGILWFTLDSTGALVPKGAPLVRGAFNLLREPDGNTAVAFDQAELISIGAGLLEISSHPTVFTFPSSTSFAFDAFGSWLFVRRNTSAGGTLEKLGYQDGAFAAAPVWVVPLAPAGVPQYGLERIAVDDVEGKIFAVEAGGVGVYSMASGARIAFLAHPDLAFPGGIDVVDALGR